SIAMLVQSHLVLIDSPPLWHDGRCRWSCGVWVFTAFILISARASSRSASRLARSHEQSCFMAAGRLPALSFEGGWPTGGAQNLPPAQALPVFAPAGCWYGLPFTRVCLSSPPWG